MVYTVVNTGGRRDDEDEAGGAALSSRPANARTKSDGFWNIDLELRALKTILTPTSDWATKVYSVCKPEFFHQSTTKAIFVHLQSLLTSSNTFELPTLDFILSDSKLSPAIREAVTAALTGASIAIVNSQGDFDILVQGLSSLSKTRALYKAAHIATNELMDSDNPDQLRKQISERLGQSLFAADADDELLAQISMGRPYNQAAEDAFNRIMNGSFEKVKVKTGFKEFDNKTGGFHRTNLVVFGANSGGGKCTHFDTQIPTNLGLLKIGAIYNLFAKSDDKGWISVPKGTLQVYTREGIKDVDGVFKTEGTTYKIETNWSDVFEGLGEHKLYCYDNSKQEFGFKRLDEIQTSDWILKAVGTQLFGNNVAIPYEPPSLAYHSQRVNDVTQYPSELSEDLATVFGLIVAEGHRSVSISNTDQDLLSYTIDSCRKLFGCERKVAQDDCTLNFNEWLSHYFAHFLGDVKSADRFVPKCIMQASEANQCSFLRGLYEGDGWVCPKDSGRWSLGLSSISKQLIYEVKALLENIGIFCKVRSKLTWATNGSANQVEKKSYELLVLRESYATFQQKIGFMSNRKKTELSRCVEHCDKMAKDGNPNYSVSGLYNRIPNAPILAYINRVFELMVGQTITVAGVSHGKPMSYQAAVGKYHTFYPNLFVKKVLEKTEGYTSKYTANLIVNSHNGFSTRDKATGENIPVAPHIRELVENDPVLITLRRQIKELCSQVWVQVSTVETKHEIVPVFDLSVPGPHEYAANGLMSHNSLMAVNLLIRQFRLGYNVVLCSYEMTDEEVLVRLLANIGEVDMGELQNNKLVPPKASQVTAAWREFNLEGYERTNGYHIICPKSETTVPEIGFRVRNLKPDVLILDYINLLGSSMGPAEAQWQKLGDISREAKILANKLNCVVILLAQIDDAYNLRYSKAIKDHANFVMAWIRDDTSKASHILNIKQIKARNAPLYDFPLGEKFEWAQFRDPDQEDRTTWPNADELMMLELRCQSLGLKPEPTVSKEYDAKIRSEAKRLVNTNMEDVAPKKDEVKEVKQPMPESTSLLYSAEDLPVDFSKLVVKESALSWPMDNTLYEDTV